MNDEAGREAGELSLLAVLAYAAAAGGFAPMIATRGGAQDAMLEGGVWRLADGMAKQLGEAVVLEAPVTSITQDAAGVNLAAGERRWRARYALVTAPPSMAARIQYAPPLPALRDGLTQRMPLGCVIKVHVAYQRPFWREKGLSGQVLSDRTDFGPWFDHSPEGGAIGGLVGFFRREAGPALGGHAAGGSPRAGAEGHRRLSGRRGVGAARLHRGGLGRDAVASRRLWRRAGARGADRLRAGAA